jgi:hypothetical protein
MLQSMLPTSGKGLFEPMLEGTGIGSLQFHEALLLSRANHWGQLDDFLVLEHGGKPVAAAAAYMSNQRDQRPLTPEGLSKVSEYLNLAVDRKKELAKRYIISFGISAALPHLIHPAEYVIEYGAYSRDFRGAGAHRIIIIAHMQRAKAMGCATVGAIAMVGNRLAFNAWNKFGGKLHSTLGPECFKNDFPGMHRFVWNIEGDLPSRDLRASDVRARRPVSS